MTFPRFFTNTAAALLLALATALFIINLTGPPHLVLPRDPISGLSFRYLFWIFALVAALLGFLCLFADRPARLVPWVAWIAVNYFVYRVGLYFDGCQSLTGFLACVTYAFGLPPKAAGFLLDLVFGYLLIGSCITLRFRWLRSSKNPLTQQSSNP
jgi:hypothetical protein